MASEQETTPQDEAPRRPLETTRGLIWVSPEERFVPFTTGKLTLGRDASASVTLPGSHVSRLHASITRLGAIHVLRDEGSRNGTRRNGARIQDARLDDGDVVRIGDWVGVAADVPLEVARSGRLFVEPLPGVVLGPRSQALWERLVRIAKSKLPVLLEAPTGCGKEVLAHALHTLSGRRGSFVAQNCAALPDSLAEAHLFGHARGAFTGAHAAAPGLFASADEGTLFLDEVVDLPVGQQAKLLRAVEEQEVTPLGSMAARRVDVRLVAASHRSLHQSVERGEFREDLLARLAGATLVIPPLRERREEAPRLFVRFFRDAGGDPASLHTSFVEALCIQDWPLNVRQLRLAAESIAANGPGAVATGDLEEALLHQPRSQREVPSVSRVSSATVGAELDTTLLGVRRAAWLRRNHTKLAALEQALGRHDGNVSGAAREIGISRQRAQRLLTVAAAVARNSAPDG